MKMYIQSIRNYPNLSIEEQKELFLTGQKEKLVNCMLKLVVKIAYKYRYKIKNLEILDIIQEGNMGLLKALEKYNPSLGAFTTYAVYWIKNYILIAIKLKEKSIKSSAHMEDLMNRYYHLIETSNSKGVVLSKEEIIKNLGISENKYKILVEALAQNVISINQSVNEETNSEVGDFLEDENAIRETNIIDEIYNNEFNISLERLNDLKRSINNKLQDKLKNKKEYLNFKNEIIKNYGSSFYNLVEDCEGIFLKGEMDRAFSEINRINNNEDLESDLNLDAVAKNNNFELLVFLKKTLSVFEYYVFYNIYFSHKNDNEIALELHLDDRKVYFNIAIMYDEIINKIKSYFKNNCQKFWDVIYDLKNEYGFNYYFLKTEAINSNDILKYLYLKDELSYEEKKIWELSLFGIFNYSIMDFAMILGVNLDECKNIINSLEEKIKNKFSDIDNFRNFSFKTMTKEKEFIFKIYPYNNIFVSYDKILQRYELLSLESILSLFTKIDYQLSSEDRECLKQYYNKNISLENKKRLVFLLGILDLKLNELDNMNKKTK